MFTFAIAAAIYLAGCAFDITSVKQRPVSFVSKTGDAKTFTLDRAVTAHLGTGFTTKLDAGTHWRQIGSTEFGNVFATKDQIVTVEASDIYEADLVVSNQVITGFYLVVEKTFTPVTRPIPIAMTASKPNSE